MKRKGRSSAACTISLAALLMYAPLVRAEGQAPADQRASRTAAATCVAILEPEVPSDMSAESRRSLSGAIETLLTSALVKQEGIVLVDRQSLDKVLNEQTLPAKPRAEPVVDPAKRFWAAGVLVCARVDTKNKVLVLEGVSAQTGQLAASVVVTGAMASAGDLAKALEPKLPVFAAALRTGALRAQDRSLLEISGKLTGSLSRLAWMVDDLGDNAGARLDTSDRVVWLVPRQPLVTKEERLLRIMGLSAAAKGDAVGGLRPVPDLRFSFELADSAKPGVTFEKTPISLKLSLRRGQEKALETRIDGVAGEWEACRDKAAAWLREKVATLDGGAKTTAADEEAAARRLAAEELAAIAPWASLSFDQQKSLEIGLRARVARHALRAAHLDPASEQASYLVACCVDALYAREGKDGTELSIGAIDRAMLETQRYLDRFKQKNVEHHRALLNHLGTMGITGIWKIDKARRNDDLLREPDVRLYPYASAYVRAWAEHGYLGHVDKRYADSNSFSAFSFNLLSRLIPCIPEDRLDAEHDYWRDFYATKVSPIIKKKRLTDFLNERPAPWELIDAGFQARKKKPLAVRENLQLLAREFPRSQTHIWGGDQWTPPQIPILLQAAGDKDWAKWQPTFGAPEEVKVDINAMTAFMSRLAPSSPGIWDYASLPQLVGEELTVPKAVRLAGERPGHDLSRTAEALAIVGGDLWLTTPAQSPGSSGQIFNLFVVPLDARGRATDKATEILWPEADKLEGTPGLLCHYVTTEKSGPTMWLGTRQHGLARFEKKDGQWKGRWYNSKHGAPTNGVTGMTTCRNGSGTELLVIDRSARRMYGSGSRAYQGDKLMVWSLNAGSSQTTIVHDGDKDVEHIYGPVIELTGGKRMLLELAGEGAYDAPPQIADIGRIVRSDVLGVNENRAPFTVDAEGLRRIWAIGDGAMKAFDNVTLAPVKGGYPGRDSSKHVSVMSSDQVRHVLGMIAAWPGSERGVRAPSWPVPDYVVFAAGRGDTIWMAINTDARSWDHTQCLVGYRPARAGSTKWSAEDAWIGPFYTPGKEPIYGLQPDGNTHMLISTHNHVLRIESGELLAQARKAGLVRSTDEWREEFKKRAAAGSWQSVVPVLIASSQFAEAEKLLDKKAADLGAAGARGEESLTLLLWRARLLAEQKERLAESIERYAEAADHPRAGHAGEAFARANQIVLLHRAGRWREVLDLAEQVQGKFSQMKANGNDSGLGWYIADARRKLAASSQPATRPAESPTRPAGASPAATKEIR